MKPPKPVRDLPGQQFIPGSAPIMPPGKIRPDTYMDPVEFAEGFTAAPETLPLFTQEDK
jgi:hypothetical protein